MEGILLVASLVWNGLRASKLHVPVNCVCRGGEGRGGAGSGSGGEVSGREMK